MKTSRLLLTLCLLGLSVTANAASEISGNQGNALMAREFAVISVNHDVINVQDAMADIRAQAASEGAAYYQIIAIHEPLANGQIHVSAVLYH
ncbi:DUF1471 domain-containing protein [Edwardsiella tarda]|uniref:DUF1471 domain-containing protein n=1 Tax=Edwardsiella tarda TaxID=636 RepID=UPI00351C79A6